MRQVVIFEPNALVREGLARLLTESGYSVADASRFNSLEGPLQPDQSIDLVLTELPDDRYRIAGWLDRIAQVFPNAKVVLLTDGPIKPDMVRSAFAGGAHGYVGKDISFAAMHAIIDAVLHGQIVCPPAMRDQLIAAVPPSEAPTLPPAVRQMEARSAHPLPRPVAAVVPVRTHSTFDTAPRSLSGSASPARQGPAATYARLPQASEVGLSERESEILFHLTEGHANKIIAHRMSISEATVKSHLKSLLRKLQFSNRTQAAIWAVNRYNGGSSSGEHGTHRAAS